MTESTPTQTPTSPLAPAPAPAGIPAGSKSKPIALVTGVGPGTGAAVCRRLAAGGYQVAMLARDGQRLERLRDEIPDSQPFVCDVSDADALHATLDRVQATMGHPSVVVHNAVGGSFATFREVDPKVLRRNFEINTMALLHLAQRLLPAMIDAGKGSLVITGNTSAQRGRPKFAGFAPTKAAQRILAESIARDIGPLGVHVAYIVIDAVIDVPWTRKSRPDAPDDFFIQPSAIADEVFHVAHQPRSAWSFNVELRPHGESW